MSTDADLRYFTPLAAAFVRGRMPELAPPAGEAPDDAQVIARGADAGLRLHKFKRNTDLPRVKRVLGALRGIAPTRGDALLQRPIVPNGLAAGVDLFGAAS